MGGQYGKKVLKWLYIATAVFILINEYTFLKTGVEQTEMIRMFFLVLFGETLSLAGIKITKVFADLRRNEGLDGAEEDSN